MAIKIRGHESFYIREGWLRKGVTAIDSDKYILSNTQEAIDMLGIGSAMVKSVRYWLQAVELTSEGRDGSKRIQTLTNGFGATIFKNDKYFEDLGSLYLLHYKLATNKNLATSWYLFFNDIKATEMTKHHMEEALTQGILKIDPKHNISSRSLSDDCNCIINSYYADNKEFNNPEDNMVCPFSELGLVKKVHYRGKEEIIYKTTPDKSKLNKLIVLYVIVDNLNNESNTTNIKNLIEDRNNIGKVFNLDKNVVNYYVDELERDGYLNVTRTAGLNTISIENNWLNNENILNKYYREI